MSSNSLYNNFRK